MYPLLDPISLRVTPDHNVFFVSDTHFGHDRDFIYKPRGYKSVIEHDAGVIDGWNKKVTNNDTVIHCGDVMFGAGGLERLENYFSNLNFKNLYFLPGNHHAGVKQFYKTHGTEQIYKSADGSEKFVTMLPNIVEFFVNGQAIVVCHYPIASWNGMAHDSWCICGHCHGSFPGSQLANPQGKILDVGIEVVQAPQSFAEVQAIMRTKSVKIVDHHDSTTKNPFNSVVK